MLPVSDFTIQFQLAVEAGFRHSWISTLSPDIRKNLIRTLPKLSMLHRKHWIDLDTLEGNFAFPGNILPSVVIVLGLGTGKSLLPLLESPTCSVIVLEKNPILVLEFLQTFDVREALESKRLQFPDPFHVFSGQINIPEGVVVQHPVLGFIYRDLLAPLFKKSPPSGFDIIMEGELLIDDWFDTLQIAGREAFIYPHFWLNPDSIVQDLSHPGVTQIWSINRIQGLENVAELVQKPYTIYEIDPDLSEIPERDKKDFFTNIFSFRRPRAVEYASKGWNAQFLPLAASPRMFPKFNAEYAADVSFVGTSIIGNARLLAQLLLQQLKTDHQRSIFLEFLSVQEKDPLLFLADEYLQKLISAGFPAVFLFNGAPVSLRKILHEWSGAMHRIYLVKALAPFKAHVWGDEGWRGICEQSGGLVYRGPAGNRIGVPQIYSSSKINVDITRNYQADVATIRLFDVFACGSICISNVARESDSLYQSPGLLLFTTPEELQQQVNTVLKWDENTRNNYIENMREQTMKKHTLAVRLHEMLGSAAGSANH